VQRDENRAATEHKNAEPAKYEKRIGTTVYRVTVHFSQLCAESLEDKLVRLMESEVRDSD